MFVLLSIPVALYVVYATVAGVVWVHRGPFPRRVVRAENPVSFWLNVTIYAGLALALATVF